MRLTEKQKKAFESVHIVRDELIKLGYSVTEAANPSTNGHDLVAIKGEKSFSVEVKTCFYSKRAWKVSPILKTESDLTAIVFEGGFVHFNKTSDHLKLCSKNRSRCLTALGRLYSKY